MPERRVWPTSLKFRFAALFLLVLLAIAGFFRPWIPRVPLATPYPGHLSVGDLKLDGLRAADADPEESRQTRVFNNKIRFVNGKQTHVVHDLSDQSEFVLQGWTIQGEVESELLAVVGGAYATLATFVASKAPALI